MSKKNFIFKIMTYTCKIKMNITSLYNNIQNKNKKY